MRVNTFDYELKPGKNTVMVSPNWEILTVKNRMVIENSNLVRADGNQMVREIISLYTRERITETKIPVTFFTEMHGKELPDQHQHEYSHIGTVFFSSNPVIVHVWLKTHDFPDPSWRE